jgi:hypothetical protein
MIDDPVKANALVQKMQASVPIPARPTGQITAYLRQRGVPLGADAKVQIKDVLYAGDEGGIMCDATPEGSPEVVVCSLTHLRIHPKHPLAGEVRAYQETRRQGIARTDGGLGVTTITRD